MKKSFVLFLFFCLSVTFAQYKWENISTTLNYKDIFKSSAGFWSISNGGAFYFNFQDSSYFTLNKSNGLSSSVINSALLTNNESLWLGYSNGLIDIYNLSTGKINVITDIFKSDKINPAINSIYSTSENVYVATNFGLSIIKLSNLSFGDTYRKFGSFDSEIKVNSILIDDVIYVCTDKGLAIQKKEAINLLNPDSWNTYPLSNTQVKKILKFNDKYFAATSKGLYQFQNNNFSILSLNNENINDIIVLNDYLYITTNTGFYKFKNNELNLISNSNGLIFNKISPLNDNDFLISTNRNITRIKNNVLTSYKPEGLDLLSLYSLTIDDMNNLYSATGKDGFGKGVYKYSNKKWSSYNLSNSPEILSNDINSVSSTNDEVYFHSWGRGISILKENKVTNYFVTNSPMLGVPQDPNFLVITGARKDKDGNLWILNYNSIDKRPMNVLTKDNKWHKYELASPLISIDLTAKELMIDKDNNKWFIGINSKGLYYFNENNTFENLKDDKWGKYNSENGLTNDVINCFAVDLRNEIWIGTDGGLFYLEYPLPKTAKNVTYGLLRSKKINSIAIDPLNRKWIGTPDGLFLVSSDGINLIDSFYNSNSPLPSSNIVSLAYDNNNGKLYVITENGMCILETEIIKPEETFDNLYVYPNPVEIGANQDNNITIDGLVRNSFVKVLNISGEIINEFEATGGRKATWNARNINGELVASGIYIIVVFDKEVNKVSKTKVAVIKK